MNRGAWSTSFPPGSHGIFNRGAEGVDGIMRPVATSGPGALFGDRVVRLWASVDNAQAGPSLLGLGRLKRMVPARRGSPQALDEISSSERPRPSMPKTNSATAPISRTMPVSTKAAS